jgi:hypothetical protein
MLNKIKEKLRNTLKVVAQKLIDLGPKEELPSEAEPKYSHQFKVTGKTGCGSDILKIQKSEEAMEVKTVRVVEGKFTIVDDKESKDFLDMDWTDEGLPPPLE